MKKFIYIVLAFAVFVALSVFFNKGCSDSAHLESSDTVRISDTIRFTDTIIRVDTFVKKVPYPVKVEVIKYDTIRPDVVISITQKTYQTDQYKVIVEGYKPALSYIETYNKQTIIRDSVIIRDSTIINNIRYRNQRWSLTIGGGIGSTPHGLQPFVGVSVGYVLWSK